MAYFTRSRVLTEHKAAGVLPFSLHDGTLVVLLGAEPCKTGPGGKVWRTMWRDFGGKREAADADSAATAAREFAEETLGLFGAPGVDQASVALAASAMEARLRDPRQAVKVVHSLKKGSYHLYLTQQPYLSPLMLRLATEQNAATRAVAGAEKSAFAWVPFQALLECVADAAPRYFLEARAHVCGSSETPPPAKSGRRRFQLHPCFASSLRLAQKCGLEDLIARAEELPLPPPPPLPRVLLASAEEPAASGHGGAAAAAEPLHPTTEAASRAAAAAAAAAQEEEEEEEEEEDEEEGAFGGGNVLQDGLGFWLAQSDIAAALRGSMSAEEAAAELPSGLFLLPPQQHHHHQQQQQQQQQERERPRRRGRRLQQPAPNGNSLQRQQQQQQPSPRAGTGPASPMAGRWAGGMPGGGGAAGAGTPAASGSSLARPSSSVDTASSLQQSRQAVAAAAVEQVVHQIEVNGRRERHRLSRKQRQKLRRQRQKNAAAAAADKEEGPAGEAAAPAGAGAKRPPSSPSRQQQQQRRGVSQAAAAALPAGHWQHAEAELEAAFQPSMRLRKRLRVVVAS